jgi:Sugar-transfer associated ATP-grasp
LPYLTETQEAGTYDLLGAIQHLAANGGPGAFRQAVDLLRLRYGTSGARYEEYFTYALWRRDRGAAFLRDFLPFSRSGAFNSALYMPDRGLAIEVMDDKLQTEALLAAKGLPVTRTRALCAPAMDPSPLPGLQRLTSAAEVAAFLSEPGHLPVFGKPRAGKYAHGAAVFQDLAGPDRLRLMNGTVAPVAALAAEIVSDWRQGYLFQPFYQSEAGLRRHTGPAMASVRIVTLQTERGVEPWYAVIRLPAASAMHDGDAFDARVWGLVDLASGRILRLRNLRDPLTADITHCLDPDTPFLGYTLPHWTEAVQICLAGHACFPGHGIVGWDVFLTDEGALLNEANATPGHLYQVAAQRPLLNPDMRPAYERALAFARKHGGGTPV